MRVAERSKFVKNSRIRRLALPVLAGLATSAVVAAFGLAGSDAAKVGGPPAAAAGGPVIGQLTLDDGAAIPILSYSWGMSNPTTIGSGSGGAGAGKVSISSLNMMKSVDQFSSQLLSSAASGSHFAHAVFTAQWGTGASAASAKYELSNVIVESVQQSGSGGSAPSESFALVFGKVVWTFTDGNGPTTGSWNVVTNAP